MTRLLGRTRARLNFREGPGREYRVLMVLEKGAPVTILENMGEWLNIQASGTVGFVKEDFIELEGGDSFSNGDPDSQQDIEKHQGVITAYLNMRNGPGLEFAVDRTIDEGEVVDILEDFGEWLNIRFRGDTGYVLEKFVELQAPEPFEIERDSEPPAAPATMPVETPAAIQSRNGGAEARPPARTEGSSTPVFLGPGEDYSIIHRLQTGEPFAVLEDHGDWIEISIEGLRGFVAAGALQTELPIQEENQPGDQALNPEGWPPVPAPSDAQEPPAGAESVPEKRKKLLLDPNAPVLERHLAYIWNQFQTEIEAAAEKLEILPAVAAAVLAVEGGGRGFGPDGRLLIRFENHVFWHYWGKNHHDTFDKFFRFDPHSPWNGHLFRLDERDPEWRSVHSRLQDVEWQAFQLAAGFSRTAARLATGMGMAQLMGFHYGEMRYTTVDDMYQDFERSESAQVKAFFEFIRGQIGPFERVEALQAREFRAFARLYNGAGQAEKYGARLQQAAGIFESLRQNGRSKRRFRAVGAR